MSLDPSYGSYLSQLEQQYSLPSGLLSAQAQTESGGDSSAISPAGAVGIFQFMPKTAKQYGIDPTDPMQSAQAAAKMNADMLQKYNGDLPSALAAYNWGQGNVDRKGLDKAPAETQNYIANITSAMGQPVQSALASVGNFIIPSAQAEEMPHDLPPGFVPEQAMTSYANQSPQEQVRQDVTENIQPQHQQENDVPPGFVPETSDPSGMGAQPWSALHIQSQALPDIQKISQGQDALNTLTGNVLPNLPLSALGAISYPLEFLHRGADYLAEHAANAVRSVVGLPPSQAQYEPFVATPGQMTSDIADAIGHPLYQPQTALGRLTANMGAGAIPAVMTGGLAGLMGLSAGTGASEVAKQLGGGDEAQYWSGLAGALAGGKLGYRGDSSPADQPSALSQMAKPLETDISKIDPNTPLAQYSNLGLRAGSDETLSSPEISDQVTQLQAVTQKIAQLEKVGSTDPAGQAQLADLNKQADAIRAQLGMTRSPEASADTNGNPTGNAGTSNSGLGGNSATSESASQQLKSSQQPIPQTAEDMGRLANAAYMAADANGGMISPQGTNKVVSVASEMIPQSEEAATVLGSNPATDLARRFQILKDKPLSLATAQELDEGLSDAIDAQSPLGKPSKQAVKLIKIQTALRDVMHSPEEGDTMGGQAGFDALAQGRAYWTQMMKMRDLERIKNNAAPELTDNPAIAIRSAVRSLLKNPNRVKFYSPEERVLLTKAANTGVLGEALRGVGSRLTQYAVGGAGLASAGPIGGLVAGAVAHGISGAARKAGAALQNAKLDNAIQGVAKNTAPKVRK